MRFGSVCSGIEAASAAWHPLGWKSSFYSEIDPFARAVLKHHYPDVPLHGDFTTIEENTYDPVDLLTGGTPCQSFSIAGLRTGLADGRGNLSLEFIRLASRLVPKGLRWVVWENVPGVLSSNKGRDFATFLGGLAECGFGFAYRVLDAQYFGVPQRRRRVIVVGYLGDWRPAAAVLFERESLLGNLTPSREAWQNLAPTIRAGAQNGGRGHGARSGDSKDELILPVAGTLSARTELSRGAQDAMGGHLIASTGDIAHCLNAGGNGMQDYETETMIVVPIHDKATRHNGGGDTRNNDGASNGLGIGSVGDPCPTLDTASRHSVASMFKIRGGCDGGGKGYLGSDEQAFTISTVQDQHLHPVMQVRRITPRECERLQGFPDDYTLIEYRNKLAKDGPRYKAIGNSWAVPKFHWLGHRIQMIEELL